MSRTSLQLPGLGYLESAGSKSAMGGDVVNTTLREWLITSDISTVRAGQVKFVSANVVTLEPGHYQLVCNIETHYQQGTHIPFVVV